MTNVIKLKFEAYRRENHVKIHSNTSFFFDLNPFRTQYKLDLYYRRRFTSVTNNIYW